MRIPQLLVAGALAALVPPDHATAQLVLHTKDGSAFLDRFGAAVAGPGDLDGDGVPDFAVGKVDTVVAYSGATGAVLFEVAGGFGPEVDGAGDFNGDGTPDLVVNGPSLGGVLVVSGVDGSFIGALSTNVHSLSGAGDVNGDGFDDIIVGDQNDDTASINAGKATVYGGPNGAVLHEFFGDSAWDNLGNAVDSAGDVNGDGFDDVVVAAFFDDANGNDSGTVKLFSGADGSTLWTWHGEFWNQTFGESVAGAGDVDGDGVPDVIVGTPDNDDLASNGGRAQVFSGADGALLFTMRGDGFLDELRVSVAAAGDVNGDGFGDVIVGAHNDDETANDGGAAFVYSGVDGSLLCRFDGDSGFAEFGAAVGSLGDVDGDGQSELIVGAPAGASNRGRVRVFSSCVEIGTPYCGPAVPNSSGRSGELRAFGSNVVGENRLQIRATGLPTGQFGYLLASQTQGFVPNAGGSQGALCLGGHIGRFVGQQSSTGVGSFTTTIDLTRIPTTPNAVGMVGESWNFQAWFRDANPSGTSNFTEGVEVVLQ